jgi:hypothetical protein
LHNLAQDEVPVRLEPAPRSNRTSEPAEFVEQFEKVLYRWAIRSKAPGQDDVEPAAAGSDFPALAWEEPGKSTN